MDESILRDLYGNLVLVDRIGTSQHKEVVFQEGNRTLRIYVYKEPNHNRPHIHAYWKKEYEISISIKDWETLVGSFPSKYLKVLKKWIQQYRVQLLDAWEEIQSGIKPELEWTKNA